jgi:transposase
MLVMSAKERLRLRVLAEVSTGSMSLSAAALKLGLSYRQMRRVRRRHEREGDGGLVHRLRGKQSNRKIAAALRTKVLELCREKYVGFGPTLVSEYLLELDEPVAVSHDTVRRWQREQGLLPQGRRRGKHRRRRERRSRCGELVQMDGSWHDWFEGRSAWCCLMVMIDDATGTVFARFYERETLDAAFDVFGRYAAAKGLPGGLYVDRAGIYRSDKEPTLEQELAGERPLTHFGRAMKTLEVELILATSPQAKGRVERVNGTLQDRLVKAMRLANLSDIASANRFLDQSFLASFNAKFNVAAADASDAHRAVAAELGEVLCEQHERKVGRDWCVQWRGTLLQIDKQHEALNLPGKSVTLQDRPGGTVQLTWQQQTLAWRQVKARPTRPRPKPTIVNNKRWTPSPHHPWKAGAEPRIKNASLPAPHGGPEEKTRELHQGTILLR